MKKLLIIVSILALIGLVARADELNSFYGAEVSLDLGVGLSTPDLDSERSHAGFGLTAYFTDNFGVGASTSFEDLSGSAFDNLTLRGLYRIPIGQNAIYGFAGARRWFNRGEWSGVGGVAVERRWAKYFATYAELGFEKQFTGTRPISATVEAGIRIPIGGK